MCESSVAQAQVSAESRDIEDLHQELRDLRAWRRRHDRLEMVLIEIGGAHFAIETVFSDMASSIPKEFHSHVNALNVLLGLMGERLKEVEES